MFSKIKAALCKIKAALCGVWNWLKKKVQTLRFVAVVVISSVKLEVSTMVARARSRRRSDSSQSQILPMQITDGVWSVM